MALPQAAARRSPASRRHGWPLSSTLSTKVFFVVASVKDLDTQTMTEYRATRLTVSMVRRGSRVKRNIERQDHKIIIVTTLQKLNNLRRSERDLPIYQKQVVFIFDECHRSQFASTSENPKEMASYSPIWALLAPLIYRKCDWHRFTQSAFGRELHSYVITDAIRDEKVLKFKVTYNDVRPKFRDSGDGARLTKLSAAENNSKTVG